MSPEERAMLFKRVRVGELMYVNDAVNDIVTALNAWAKEINTKNAARNARLDALEQRNEELQQRVLELEAQRAIAHVER